MESRRNFVRNPLFIVVAVGVVAVIVVVVLALWLAGEPTKQAERIAELQKFLLIGVQIAPFAVLAAFAYGGVRSTVAAAFAYICLAFVAFGVLFNSLASVFIVVVNVSAVLNRSTAPTPGEIFKPGAGQALVVTALLLMLVSLISLAMLLRPVRVVISRVIPIDPDNLVHKIALCILTLIALSSFVPLIALGGHPPILELITQGQTGNDLQDLGISAGPLDLVYQFMWTIPATLVAAGWPVVRRFKEALVRLGMVRPTVQQVAAAPLLGLGLAAVAAFALDPGIHQLWTALGWPTTDTAAFEKLLGQLMTPIGAVLIGVTAGVGEEMAVRGLLQPRIGLIASNLVFTSLHAFQYGLDALLSVFIIGLILGIIRARSNTTTSAIVHGTYDFVLVMASALAPR